MVIICDTREQKCLEFSVPTKRGTLAVGDYRAEFSDGSVSQVVFERKGIGDLFSTLSGQYERIKREIEKAKEEDIKIIIIIEGSLRRVLAGYKHSQRTPISIVFQLFTLRVRYNIEAVFCNNREEMSQYIFHLFTALERERQDDTANSTVAP